MLKLMAQKLIKVCFTCWNEHKTNNYNPVTFTGVILKKVFLDTLYGSVSIHYQHPIIFCPICNMPHKLTWMEEV